MGRRGEGSRFSFSSPFLSVLPGFVPSLFLLWMLGDRISSFQISSIFFQFFSAPFFSLLLLFHIYRPHPSFLSPPFSWWRCGKLIIDCATRLSTMRRTYPSSFLVCQAASHIHRPKLDLDPIYHLNCTILMPPPPSISITSVFISLYLLLWY